MLKNVCVFTPKNSEKKWEKEIRLYLIIISVQKNFRNKAKVKFVLTLFQQSLLEIDCLFICRYNFK